jgi:hypothetical protein
MDTDLDDCTCEACQKEVSIETPAGNVRLEFISPRLTGSYFDHPACLIAVEDYDETADLFGLMEAV